MIITQISKQKKKDNRFNLYLDGRFYCGLTAESIVKAKLKEGMEISQEIIDQIQLESEKESCIEKVINYIGSRLRTKQQIVTYLKGKGYTGFVIDYVIDKLLEYNFIDDNNYVRAYVEQNSKKKGLKLIQMELKQKGISDKLIKDYMEGREDDKDSLMVLATKYIKNKERNQETAAKLSRYLYSKGYSFDDINFVVRKLIKEEE